MVTMTQKEWRWAGGWSIAILLLSCVPYLIALLLTPEGWQFAGILVNPMDGHSYMAKMRQGFEGGWLFHLTYTHEPHPGALIFTFYLLLGHLAALTGLPLVVVFHLVRLAAGFCLLLASFRLIGLVTSDLNERRLAFILVCSASGLGWLGAFVGTQPIDLWVPEAFIPYSLYSSPHFSLGLALMALIFQGALEPGRRAWLWGGVAALVLALILPFGLLTVWAILAIFIGWLYLVGRRLPVPQIWLAVSVGLCSAPVIFYDYWVSTTDPILAGWGAQNITPAPPLVDFWLGYGLVGLLAVAGGWQVVRQGERRAGEWLVLCWAVGTVLLVYFPFDLQRRLINGLHIPICILAAIGLKRSLKLSHRRHVTTAVITLGAVGTLFVWLVPLLAVAFQSPNQSELTALLFIRREEEAAFAWLREHTTLDDVILASPRVGMFVPGQTGARVFYGHPFETIAADTKKEQVEAFYQGKSALPSAVTFIFYGPSERALGEGVPQILSDFPVTFDQDGVTIYETDSASQLFLAQRFKPLLR